ncbi:MAG: 4-(cytidine 5'-diphospho)-2-C-methyl-D-erythritol kinase [Bacteroidales bacterium]|jgi:4-diphosphocytidyl-2-C-methyl-D-erythritol kinase
MVVFPGAKINIGLYVTEKRTDGFHNIETLFYPIGLTDILEVIPDPKAQPGTIKLTLSGIKVEGSQDTNLVVKAYRLLHDRCNLPGAEVFLHKCIPSGAGLGGGSSDGASMLLVLNRLFNLNLSYCDLFDVALQLGSDCPFFLDPIPSFAHGRGEELRDAAVTLKGHYIMLFHTGVGISTAAAYKNVKVSEPDAPIDITESMPVETWKLKVTNAFEPFALDQQPVIRLIRDELYRAGALYASMTGSGSAVYGLFSSQTKVPKGISCYCIWKEKL